MRKKIPRRDYNLSAEVPDFDQSESPSGIMGSSFSVPWQIPGPSHLPATADSVGFDSPIAQELPKNIDYLEAWLQNHSDHPYPTEEETQELCYDTGLSASQVSDWMMNASYFVYQVLFRVLVKYANQFFFFALRPDVVYNYKRWIPRRIGQFSRVSVVFSC